MTKDKLQKGIGNGLVILAFVYFSGGTFVLIYVGLSTVSPESMFLYNIVASVFLMLMTGYLCNLLRRMFKHA